MNQSRPRGKIRLILLLAVLYTILAFALFEAYVTLTREKTDLYALTGRSLTCNPMSRWAVVDAFCAYRPRPGQYAAGKTVNSHGFLSTPEIASPKSPGVTRIVFLGGSSTAGTGFNLPDKDTWPWRTMEMLKTLAPGNYEFINAAVGGYSSFESYGRLWSRIRHYSPDIVVVCHGWNEMYYFDKAENIISWRTRPDGSWSIDATSKTVAVYAPRWIDPIVAWSQALSLLRIRFSRPLEGEVGPSPAKPLSAEFDRAGIDIWRTNLRLLKQACVVMNAGLFVAKQPTLIVPGLPENQRARCRYDFHGFDHEAHTRAFAEIYRVIEEEIEPTAIIDLTPISGRSECFFDHVHPNPDGCREIAAITARALASHITKNSGGSTESGENSE